MKPYTVSGNLICVDFSTVSESEHAGAILPALWQSIAGHLDAYDQLNDPGEVLYISPPCDVEPSNSSA